MYALKALFVLSIIGYVYSLPMSPEEISKQNWANANKCKEEFHVDGSLKDVFMTDQEQPENVNCFLECTFKKNGIIKDGAIDKDKYIQVLTIHISPNFAAQIAEACMKNADVSSCEGAGKLHICTVKKAKELHAGELEVM